MQTRFVPCSFAVVAAALFAQGGVHAAVGTAKIAPPSVAASGSASDSLAQESAPSPPGTPQRSKMKACNADAKSKDLHGDERRKFMSQCLSGKAPPQHS